MQRREISTIKSGAFLINNKKNSNNDYSHNNNKQKNQHQNFIHKIDIFWITLNYYNA